MKRFARTLLLPVMMSAGAISGALAAERYAGGYLSGNQLHGMCREDKPTASSYIVGITDELLLWSRATKARNLCLQMNVTSEQLTDVVCKALDADPASRNNPASALATAALMKAWPCGN